MGSGCVKHVRYLGSYGMWLAVLNLCVANIIILLIPYSRKILRATNFEDFEVSPQKNYPENFCQNMHMHMHMASLLYSNI